MRVSCIDNLCDVSFIIISMSFIQRIVSEANRLNFDRNCILLSANSLNDRSRLFKAVCSIFLDYHHWTHFEIPFAKVSWVRHRDIHILTAGAYTYTSDQRFQALHRQNTGQNSEWSEWTLCIKWAQERDQGLYECQISTIPVKSHQFRLNVVGKFISSVTLCATYTVAEFVK